MPNKHRVVSGNSKFDVITPDSVPEIYCDGVLNVMIGVPICKFVLFSAGSNPSQDNDSRLVEQRNVTYNVAIPTNSLLDFAKHVLASFEANKVPVNAALDEYKNLLHVNLNNTTPVIAVDKVSTP